MAGGFLQDWFRRPPPLPGPSPEIDQAVAELDQLARAKPALAGPAAMLREILPSLFGTPIRSQVPALSPERARDKLARGMSLLQGEAFGVDDEAFRRHWANLCTVFQHHQGGDTGQKLLQSLEAGRLNPSELLGHVLAGRPEALQARAQALGVDGGVMLTLVRLLLIPVLAPVNAAWLPLRRGVAWEAGSCPTCGSLPLLGEVRGFGPLRTLRCGLCTAAWDFPHGICPFCGIDDAPFLGSFQVPGEDPRYLAATCEACKCYLKMRTGPAPLSGPQLLVADLGSMFLDVAAAERGYSAAE